MTQTNHTAVVIILDRSGSMETIKNDVIGGFNTMMEEQKKVAGTCTVTLTQFDDDNGKSDVEIVYTGKSVVDVPPLELVPRGGTPLLDAVGKTIVATEKHIKELAENERPDKVLVLIITDGHENASRQYKRSEIKALIERHQGEPHKWVFAYLGATADAFDEAASIGVPTSSSSPFIANTVSAGAAFAASSQNLVSMRSGGSYGYNTQQRQAMNQPDAAVNTTNVAPQVIFGTTNLLCGCPIDNSGATLHNIACKHANITTGGSNQ